MVKIFFKCRENGIDRLYETENCAAFAYDFTINFDE